jgi:hypothetical protein
MCYSTDPLCKQISGISLSNPDIQEEKEDFSPTPLLPAFLEEEEKRIKSLPNKQLFLKDYYKTALLIFKVAKSALTCLENKELCQFDALVGDTSCQIPALIVTSFVKEEQVGMKKELIKLSSTLDEKIQVIAQNMKTCGDKMTSSSLLEVLTPFDLTVPKKIIPLIQARLLKEVRSLEEPYLGLNKKQPPLKPPICAVCQKEAIFAIKDRTTPCNLNHFLPKIKYGGPPKETLNTITDSSQKALAQFSCDFIAQATESAGLDKTLSTMLGEQNIRVISNKPQLPCLYTISAVFEIAAKKQIPILLTVRDAKHTEETLKDPYDLMFYYVAPNGKYVRGIPKKAQLDDPLIVIEGQRCGNKVALREYQKRLLSFDILHLLKLNAASHAQYTGDGESFPRNIKLITQDEKSQIEQLMKEAEKQGAFPRKNQSTLDITHIYPSTLRCEKNNERKKDIIVVIP